MYEDKHIGVRVEIKILLKMLGIKPESFLGWLFARIWHCLIDINIHD